MQKGKLGFLWLIILSVAFMFILFSVSAFAGEKPWTVKIRPGFMTGNSDVGTDAYVDILIPLWGDERRLLFFNPTFRIDDNDGNEQNIGFGFRRMSDCGHFILGGNLFYDTMRSERNQQYQQWGIGAELLSHWVDLRANYYDPFGDTDNVIGGTTSSGYYFSSHSLLTSGGLQNEEALDGFDAEVSVLIPVISKVMESRVAATYYNFDRDGGDDLDGWRGRLEVRPVKAINLNVEYRDDDARGSDTFFGGYLEIPFSVDNLVAGKNPFSGTGDLWKFGQGVRPLNERMTDKVVRDRHIVTAANEGQGGGVQTVVDDQMIFVNQDNAQDNPDGSFENPYPTLEQAMADQNRFAPGAWIYVFSSDDTADTYENARVVLLDNMVLWGQGYQHPVYGLGGGPQPILDGGYTGGEKIDYASASVIVLADNNEVMGLTVQNGLEGIYGSNIKNAHIHDNLIRWNPAPGQPGDASGIHISNLFSPADINGQTVNYVIGNNQITDNGSVGIYLKNVIDGNGSPISNVTINNTIEGNTLYGNFNSTSDADANANVYVHNNVYGGGVTGLAINNTFTENEIRHCENGSCSNIIDIGIKLNNWVDLYVGDGSAPAIYAGDISNVRFNNLFDGNSISSLERSANSDSGTAVFMYQFMRANVVTDAWSENTVTNNDFIANGGSGLYSSGNGIKAQQPMTNVHQIWNVTGNQIVDNGRYGFHANNDELSTSSDTWTNSSTEFYFRDNTVTGNGHTPLNQWDQPDGIYLYTDTSRDGISRKFLLQGNLVANNDGDGLDFYWNGTNAASMQCDFGGGALGSTGGNAFYGNGYTEYEFDIAQDDTYFISSARSNWWGQAGGPTAGQASRPDKLDAASPLSANPFP